VQKCAADKAGCSPVVESTHAVA